MEELKKYHEYADELERRIRLKTYPVAVKFLQNESDIPEAAKRPLRDLGYHLTQCQAFYLTRCGGQTIALLKEDHWCFEPVTGYGLAEPPQRFLEGHNRYPKDVATLEAGANYASEFPCLEVGKYVGVVAAPLGTTTFEPDMVMIYCDSVQLFLLLKGGEHKEGYNLKTAISSHAACVYALVPPMKTGGYQVAMPCGGDRYHAQASDEELIFTIPRDRLEDLLSGLRHVSTTGAVLPRPRDLRIEYPKQAIYAELGESQGLSKGKYSG
jgi:uncharacterized protein (DUF169 family)